MQCGAERVHRTVRSSRIGGLWQRSSFMPHYEEGSKGRE